MNFGIIVFIILFFALIGVLPTWGYSRKWGYAPLGSIGALLVIFILLWLLGAF